MAKLPTITLEHPKTKERRTLNRFHYQRNPGKWNKWRVVGERNSGVQNGEVMLALAEDAAERKRLLKPGHISQGDAKRRYDQNIITVTGETAEQIAKQARRAPQ